MMEVVDTSYLIRPGNSALPAGADLTRIQARASTRGNALVVTDALLADLFCRRPENWSKQIPKLRFLAKNPDIVFVARGVGEMLRAEVHSGMPPRRIIDRTYTEAFRRILRTGCELPSHVETVLDRERMVPAIRAAAATHASMDTLAKHRGEFRDLAKDWVQNAGQTIGGTTDLSKWARPVADRVLELVELPHKPGYRSLREPRRSAVRSVRARVLASAYLLALTDSMENRTQYGSDVQNTHHDLEHLIVASYCDVLHTGDNLQQRLYEGLRRVLEVLAHQAEYA